MNDPVSRELERLGFDPNAYVRRSTGHDAWAFIPVGDVCPELAGRPARIVAYFTFNDLPGSNLLHIQYRSKHGGWYSAAWPFGYFTRAQLQNDLVEFVETRDRHDQGVQHNYHPGLPND